MKAIMPIDEAFKLYGDGNLMLKNFNGFDYIIFWFDHGLCGYIYKSDPFVCKVYSKDFDRMYEYVTGNRIYTTLEGAFIKAYGDYVVEREIFICE